MVESYETAYQNEITTAAAKSLALTAMVTVKKLPVMIHDPGGGAMVCGFG
jgi:hypothetical protein